MLQTGQGIAYSKYPKSPHAIYVTLAARDFYNPVSGAIKPNTIAHPDAFVIDKPSSSGGAASNENGYLGGQTVIDISQLMRQQGMTWLASVYIDNSQGVGTVILRNRGSGLTVCAPPCTQGVYPLLLPEGSQFSFDCAYVDSQADNLSTLPSFGTYPDTSTDISGGGGTFYGIPVESGFLRFQFTDVVMPLAQWSTRNMMTGIWYDFPTTITTSNVFQTVLAKNPFRKGYLIGNAINAVESLFVSLHQDLETDTLAASVGLSPGQFMQDKAPPCYTGAIRVAAATAGHVVVVKEFQ